jgi:hypothetical protein
VTSKKPKAAAKKGTKPAAKAEKSAPQSRLAVLLDNRPLPDDEARTLWQEFSRHMDEHEGDLSGFAKQKGWSSVKPEHRQGRAVLVVTS